MALGTNERLSCRWRVCGVNDSGINSSGRRCESRCEALTSAPLADCIACAVGTPLVCCAALRLGINAT